MSLYETESEYVKLLSFLSEDFRGGLMELAANPKGAHIIKPDEIDILFSNSQMLIELHKSLLECLKDGYNQSKSQTDLLKCVNMLIDSFALYEHYAEGYKESILVFHKCKANSRFNYHLERIETSVKVNNDLLTVLAEPIRRLSEYPDLLKKEAPKPTLKLKNALVELKKLVDGVHYRRVEVENITMCSRVRFSVTGSENMLIKFIENCENRKLISENEVKSEPTADGQWDEMKYYLFSDYFLLCKSPSKSYRISKKKKAMDLIGCDRLDKVIIRCLNESENYEHRILVKFRFSGITLLFPGSKEKKAFFKEYRSAIGATYKDMPILDYRLKWNKLHGKLESSMRGNTIHSFRNDLFSICGSTSDGKVINSIFKFSIVSMKWELLTPSGEVPVPIYGHASALVGNFVYVFGGAKSSGEESDSLYSYDLLLNSWKLIKTSKSPKKRRGHTLNAWPDRNKLVLFGGKRKSTPLNDVYLFDIKEGEWEEVETNGEVPVPRYEQASDIYENTLYIVGGKSSSGGFYNDIFGLDLDSLYWAQPDTDVYGFCPFKAVSCVEIIRDRMVLFGSGDVDKAGLSVDILDLNQSKWSKAKIEGSVHPTRSVLSTTTLNDVVYVFEKNTLFTIRFLAEFADEFDDTINLTKKQYVFRPGFAQRASSTSEAIGIAQDIKVKRTKSAGGSSYSNREWSGGSSSSSRRRYGVIQVGRKEEKDKKTEEKVEQPPEQKKIYTRHISRKHSDPDRRERDLHVRNLQESKSQGNSFDAAAAIADMSIDKAFDGSQRTQRNQAVTPPSIPPRPAHIDGSLKKSRSELAIASLRGEGGFEVEDPASSPRSNMMLRVKAPNSARNKETLEVNIDAAAAATAEEEGADSNQSGDDEVKSLKNKKDGSTIDEDMKLLMMLEKTVKDSDAEEEEEDSGSYESGSESLSGDEDSDASDNSYEEESDEESESASSRSEGYSGESDGYGDSDQEYSGQESPKVTDEGETSLKGKPKEEYGAPEFIQRSTEEISTIDILTQMMKEKYEDVSSIFNCLDDIEGQELVIGRKYLSNVYLLNTKLINQLNTLNYYMEARVNNLKEITAHIKLHRSGYVNLLHCEISKIADYDSFVDVLISNFPVFIKESARDILLKTMRRHEEAELADEAREHLKESLFIFDEDGDHVQLSEEEWIKLIRGSHFRVASHDSGLTFDIYFNDYSRECYLLAETGKKRLLVKFNSYSDMRKLEIAKITIASTVEVEPDKLILKFMDSNGELIRIANQSDWDYAFFLSTTNRINIAKLNDDQQSYTGEGISSTAIEKKIVPMRLLCY